MAKNKNRQREFVADKIPLVSVIIPMYNAARFISQTLESLLYQTMEDFEVIIVDDCSTDNSVEVVESFAEKFTGRLHVIKLPKNTGMPSLPRNVGINFARGKYIAFLDNDDLFTKTALEELSGLAENFQADVVHTDGFFFLDNAKLQVANTQKLLDTKNYRVVVCNPKSPRLPKPTFAPNNFAERMQLWLNSDYHWTTWALFCRRDFWTSNQISFPSMSVSDDIIANFACLCQSEKVLRIPNITYIYRYHIDSTSHENDSLEKAFHKWLSNLNVGFNELNKVMNRFAFFDEHPDYRYAVLNWFFEKVIQQGRQITKAYDQIYAFSLNPLVKKEFHPDDAAFASYLFDTVNNQRLQIMQLQRELAKFQQQ